MTEYADVSADVMGELRSICSSLPDAYEEQAWAGTRWRIRKRTFDWSEVAELLTESYCVLAPKKLANLIDRPAEG